MFSAKMRCSRSAATPARIERHWAHVRDQWMLLDDRRHVVVQRDERPGSGVHEDDAALLADCRAELAEAPVGDLAHLGDEPHAEGHR